MFPPDIHVTDQAASSFLSLLAVLLLPLLLPEARKPAFQLNIDFGDSIGVRKTSAQITKRYQRQELVGKQVIAVVNFPKKQIANFMSECLLLGAVQGEEVTVLNPDLPVPNGLRIG